MKKSVAKKAVKNKKKKKVRPEVTLNFLKISKSAEAPEYALDTDAGFDLKALESVTIFPFDQKKSVLELQ